MATFSVSPGIVVQEIDQSGIIPAVSTTQGALGGVFAWGPVNDRTLVTSETDLYTRFGYPTDSNFETWFTGANFLAYGNQLWVSRACSNDTFSAIAGPSYNAATSSNTTVKNLIDYEAQGVTVANSGSTYYAAKFPGALGNSLRISVCDSAAAFTSNFTGNANNTVSISFTVGSNVGVVSVVSTANDIAGANTTANNILSALSVNDYLKAGNSTVGTQFLKITGLDATTTAANSSSMKFNVNLSTIFTLSSNVTQLSPNTSVTAFTRYWEFYSSVDKAPNTTPYTTNRGGSGDEMHVVIVDDGGQFTGTKGEVLELWPSLSRATDAQGEQGGSIFYQTFLNNSSSYVWWAYDRAGASSNTAKNMTPSGTTTPLSLHFYGGTDGDDETTIDIGDLASAYDQFASAEAINVSLILQGKARGGVLDSQLGNYLIDNIAETRMDCVVFISPRREAVVQNFNTPEEDIVACRNQYRASSYAVMDSGYKYQYDRYNDLYRWVPLNGDIAGLCVRTDDTRDAWWSPAGFTRGQIKNVVKLAFNPNKAQRDILYPADVNPVVTFPGQGTILYGDKTMLGQPSAFNRINVRRLFIVLEKAISIAANMMLFEFNDAFTRAQFVNMVDPYLRQIQGLRGIEAYRVICDTTNNTADVINNNAFVGDIFISPARSINFITLRFTAVRSGVDFSEITAGQ